MADKIYSWDEYATHTSPTDCWQLIDGVLYDTTTYLVEHPGGQEILLKHSGLDGTKRFNQANHTEYAKSIRDARRVVAPQGHEQKVKNIQEQYFQKKKQRELERRQKIRQQIAEAKAKQKQKSGSNLWILILLLLIVAGAIGYQWL